MRRLMAMLAGGAMLAAGGSCNTQPATQLIQIILVQPQVVASTGPNVVANPGQVVTLDASGSGILVGGTIFLSATQSDMTFAWEIDAVFDQNGNPIPTPADAMLTNVNASQANFTATTLADYEIEVICTVGTRQGVSRTGVRVVAP